MHRLPVGKRTRLAELERTMELAERHVTCWLESLQAIRDEGLFHDQYETFEEYCEKRWGKTRRRINQLLAHREIVNQIADQSTPGLGTRVPNGAYVREEIPLPEKEFQTRQLAALPEEERGDAWEAAVELANGKQPTAGQVREVVDTKKAETNGDTVDQRGQIVDAEGSPVPELALPAFDAAKEIVGVCREMDSLIRRVEGIAKAPGGRLIHFDSFKQQVKDAKGSLFANRATHVCPYCKGKGGKCQCCKGEGWTAKHVWAQAPGNHDKAK